MAGLHRTRPKENEWNSGRVNRAMRPIRWNIGDLAGRKFGTAGDAVFPFEQNKAAAGQSLIGFRMIAFVVVVTTSQVIFGSHLSWVNDCRAKEDITIRLALIKGVVLVTDGVILFADSFTGLTITD